MRRKTLVRLGWGVGALSAAILIGCRDNPLGVKNTQQPSVEGVFSSPLTVETAVSKLFEQLYNGQMGNADDLFTQSGPLAARVIVNRVWGWHFGRPLVATESDFGVQGDKPTHPELLNDLTARFMANGMSLKWLHREIMLSATYRQSSRPRLDQHC